MKKWLYGMTCLWIATDAIQIKMDQTNENRQVCAGMYSQAAWGGMDDPQVTVTINKDEVSNEPDPIISVIIFEWNDYELIGVFPTPESETKDYICDKETISLNYCNVNQTGEFVMAPNATKLSKNLLYTRAIHVKDPGPPSNYSVKKTGYYCVGTTAFQPKDLAFEAIVDFRNAYGQLPGSQIAKLPFYGSITIAYAVIGAFWAFLYAQHRHDILPVQNYITAIIIILVVEMLMTWGFYDFLNRNGPFLGSKILLVIVAVLNAGRNSFSFFLLLIVCMGYGVVKDSLGKTMIYVRWLSGAHFIFSLIYAVISLTVAPENAGPLVLLVILPLAGTLTTFYIWTLNSLNYTLKDLSNRKQTVKALMYRRLWWAILVSVIVIFGFFFFNSFTFVSRNDPDSVPFHWKSRWFILDGWLNLVYLADVIFIAYLWRPTENNRRFAMSDELAQDDESFEIADFGVEEDDDLDSTMGHTADGNQTKQNGLRYDPSLKSTGRKHANNAQRESFEGDTVFAVGEDGDKWTDDERDDEEQTKLVNKSSKAF